MSSMTSIIKLIALSGASDESPPCYLLQIDEFRILLDCGWDEKFDLAIIRELRRHVQLIDAVLLTFPDTLHLGALPYVVGKCDLNCPIYATMPVYKMGQMFMYDLYQSRNNMEEFDLFTLDDVDAAFDKVIQLKYNETVALKGRGYGITITPLAAGHMVGGTAWKIVKDGQEDIIYAVDYNHKKERHLNGCDLGRISRPSLLITDTCNMTYQQARRRARDELLMTNILQTMRNGGNVLITVDTAGRMLELAHMLDQLWRNKDSGLLAYSLALLSNVSYNVVEFAKSQIEWMSDKLMKMFEGARNNPFHFKHVQLCHSFQELHRVSPPMVVLASTPDMECGYSRELFIQWAGNPNNSIIITNRASPGTLARQLIDLPSDNRSITLLIKKRIPLEGTELEEYEKRQQEVKEKEQNALVELSSDSEDEDILNVSKGKHDLLVKTQGKQPAFFKSNRKHHPMFPFREEKTKYDDYGEIISLKYGDFKLEESTETISESFNEKPTHNTNIDITEVPSKCVSFLRTINVEAMVQYIDFEGRSDGESIQKIITTMNPRRLILLRGTEDSVKAAIAYTKRFTDTKVYAPKIGQVVDVTTESHIYQVRLTDALASALEFKKTKDCEIVWIDAMVAPKTGETMPTGKLADDNLEDMDTNEQDNVSMIDGKMDDGVYNLESVALDKATQHAPVFINELKLSDFKQILVKYNIDADIAGGILFCCGGTIAVRKIDKGKVVLEGCLSEDYYRVRELLYDQYAIL